MRCGAAPTRRRDPLSDRLNRAASTGGGLAAAGHIALPACATLLPGAAYAGRPTQPRRDQLVIDSALRAGSHRPIHPGGRS
ncbi:hypothetical protein B6264_24300 [Kitasatospora aureofaciens]|nr:hypothetical protein B6264_24300 [Kitasatospora aureofaciens]